MSVLHEIFDHKRAEIARQRREVPLELVQGWADRSPLPPDFERALRRSPMKPALIAEVKVASPSRGDLAPGADPLHVAEIYRRNGAAAVSVLTDERYFKGHLDHLSRIAAGLPNLPLLRKDFILDPHQVYTARAVGAAAVLLIAAALPASLLHELHHLCRQLGMAALVEVHSLEDLEPALSCEARLIGINNRDLNSFTVDLSTTGNLLPKVPSAVCVVSESGIRSGADVARMAALGVDAVLVGEALVTATDMAAKVRELCGRMPRRSKGQLTGGSSDKGLADKDEDRMAGSPQHKGGGR